MGKQRKCFLKAFTQQFRIDLQSVPLAFAFHSHQSKKAPSALLLCQRGGRLQTGCSAVPPPLVQQPSRVRLLGTERSKGLVRDQAWLKGKSIKKIRDSPNAHTPNLLPHTSQKAFHCKTGPKVQTAMSLLPFIPTVENQSLTGITAHRVVGNDDLPLSFLSPTHHSVIQQP